MGKKNKKKKQQSFHTSRAKKKFTAKGAKKQKPQPAQAEHHREPPAANQRWQKGGKSRKWGLTKKALKGETANSSPKPRTKQAGPGKGSRKNKLTKLQTLMQSKIESAKFRWLNEKLFVIVSLLIPLPPTTT